MRPLPQPARYVIAAFLTATAVCGFSRSGWPQTNALAPGFVRLSDAAPAILQDMRYAGAFNFTAARVPGYDAAACILRASAAKALQRAQSLLEREGLRLKVYDCYRPARAVRAFAAWARAPETGGLKHVFYPHIDKARLFQLGYISSQSKHSRGIAVDIGLERADKPVTMQAEKAGGCDGPSRVAESALDFGTAYDCFSPLSATLHPRISADARVNRLKLLTALRAHGFRNYAREWWHFEFSDPNAPVQAFDFPVR
jgi:zinc D-Ala-D-Ala dipeptidase